MVYACAFAVLPRPQTDFIRASRNRKLCDGDGYNHVRELILTDSFATDIALEGTALASGPFGSGSCESR